MARQQEVSRVAQETGLAQEALYRALSSKANPESATIVGDHGARVAVASEEEDRRNDG